jgi:PAS domain S-box-containing protein
MAAVVLGLYLSSLHSYLLFHSLIEIFTIAIAFTLFILTWNTRGYLANDYLKLLGIGYAFISLIDLLHALAYKGMNVFPGYGANLATQLWIAARYLQAATLLTAPFFFKRRMGHRAILGGYAAAVLVLVALVYSDNFPDCFIEGKGLTPFKIGSEYLISFFLLIALYLLYRKREYFNDQVFFLVTASIACTVVSEISFTAYISVYGFANMVGHFSKLAAFYLIYRAILVTGLREPFDLIFRDLKQTEEALRKSQDTLEEKVGERTAELRASEERYRSLIQNIQAAVVVHGSQTEVITSNSFAQTLLGLTEDQMRGKEVIDPAWSFLREDATVMPVEEYPVSRVVAARHPLRDFIVGINRPDLGTVIWALVNADPVFSDEGKLSQVLVSFVDITERKQAQEELKRIEWMLSKKHTSAMEGQGDDQDQGYGDLTALNRDGVILKSVGRDVLGSIAADYLDLLGTSSAIYEANGDYAFGIFASNWCRMLDRSSRKLCDTDDNAAALSSGLWLCHESCWTRCSKEAIATLAPVDIECSGGIRLYGVPIVAGKTVIGSINFGYGDIPKDPVKLRALAKAYHLYYEDLLAQSNAYDSRPPYIIEMAKSRLHASARLIGTLVERKRAEEALRQLNETLRATLDAAPVGIFDLDLEGRVKSIWNPAAEQMLDWHRDEVLGHFLPSVPEDGKEEFARFREWVRSGKSIIGKDVVRRRKDGSLIEYSIYAAPEYDDEGRVAGNIAVIVDITERKRAEEEIRKLNVELEQRVRDRTAQLEAANQELEAFAYSVSHDLRAPLRHIDGFLELLQKRSATALDERSRHYMATISDSTRRMGMLIDDLLSFSRMGRHQMTKMEVDLGDLVQEVVTELEPEAKGRAVHWQVASLPVVRGDRAMLRIAFINMISNALKFSSPRPEAEVEIGWKPGPEGETVVFIRDNGVGFDMEYVDKLFGVFQRLHRTDEFEGTGIGLANVRRIIDRHGGRTWAEGKVDRGATFYFSLP